MYRSLVTFSFTHAGIRLLPVLVLALLLALFPAAPVHAASTPPTITAIANQIINMGSSTGALKFTVSDAVTPAPSLIVTAAASNTALVPLSGLVLMGPDSQGLCAVTVTPKSVYSGVTTITLTVKNALALTAKFSFTVTVNRAPTITTITNQLINMGTSTAALAFTVSDKVTPAASLSVSAVSSNTALVHADGLLLTGPDAQGLCAITVTPVAVYSGLTTITLAVKNGGGLTAKTSFTVTVNHTPTITKIANQSINFNANTGALPFTVGDDLTVVGALTVTGVSNKPTLFPSIRIVLGGSGAARTVAVTPAANQSGTGTITLTVKDGGGLTSSTSFSVTVNAPPTISTITNQLINMGTATNALPFTVGDDLTTASALTVTGVSSNTALLKAANIVLAGPDAQGRCSVALTPVAIYSGMSTITLTVKDGAGLTSKTSFVLTVHGRPTITVIPNQTMYVLTAGSTTLPFTVGDDLTPPDALQVSCICSTSLIPISNLILGGTGASRTITFTPGSGQSGTAKITLTVTDGSGLSSGTNFMLTVIAKNAIDGAELVWAPGGDFTMGSEYGGAVADSPYTQRVTLSGYWIYKYPITVAQYLAFCAVTGYTPPPWPGNQLSWLNKSGWTDPSLQQHPIVNVSWDDAAAYAAWAQVNLPTEAQYEYAVRGAAGNNYPWGGTATAADPYNGWDQTKCANWLNSYTQNISTWPVGSFPAGASWCGAQDLVGNVWEWCSDCLGDYSATPVINPLGPSTGAERVGRGGSWYQGGYDINEATPNLYRGAFHYGCYPQDHWSNDGFRCVALVPVP